MGAAVTLVWQHAPNEPPCCLVYESLTGEYPREEDIVSVGRGDGWVVNTMRNGWQTRLDGIQWSIYKPE